MHVKIVFDFLWRKSHEGTPREMKRARVVAKIGAFRVD